MDTYGNTNGIIFEYLFRLEITPYSSIDLIVSPTKYKNQRLAHDYYVSSKINNNPILYVILYIIKILYYYGFIEYEIYLQIKRMVSKIYSKKGTVMEIKPRIKL